MRIITLPADFIDSHSTRLCGCGCGGNTSISTFGNRKRGLFVGCPKQFIFGHAIRVRPGNKGAQPKITRDNKRCTSCGDLKPIEEFRSQPKARDLRASTCNNCHRATEKQRRLSDTDSYKDKRRRRNYGLPLGEYSRMFAAQSGVCAICGNPETDRANDGITIRALAVDHCHATGQVRGLLCSSCNKLLGYAKDSPDLLEQAAAYLYKFAK